MVLPRNAALQRLVNRRSLCVRCCFRQNQTSWLPRAAAPLSLGRRYLSTTKVLESELNEAKDQELFAQIHELLGQDPAHGEQQPSREPQRDPTEVETFKDIRSYLREWQAVNPNTLDPVQEPDSILGDDPMGGAMISRESDVVWNTTNLSTEDDFDISDEFMGDHLEPGDMVACLSHDGTFSFAIYVQSVHRRKQFYTSRGNWRLCRNSELDYVIKGFAPPELLDPIKPYFPKGVPKTNPNVQVIPEGGLPRPVGAPLLEMMGNFEEHILEFYRLHSRQLDDLHTLVADETEFRRLTIEEMAMQALGIEESELHSVNLFATHQAIRRHPFILEKDSLDIFSSMYLVQPKRIAATVSQVTTWFHEHQEYLTRFAMGKAHQEFLDAMASTTTGLTSKSFPAHPMQQFIAKAQRLIRLSRKVRSPTIMSSVGPSSQSFQPDQDGKPMVFREVLTEKFNENDQKIIEYLQMYATPGVIMPSGSLKSTASHIMRATGMYNTMGLSESSTRLFLQELGVVSPWENLSLLDQNLLLPGHGVSLMEDMRWEEIEEACGNLSETMVDSMKHLRKDWGDLPVYCIDDVTAQEIDDAVSLERIPGSEDTFWVHIHVANPTAFLDHDDPIVEYAGSRLMTTYAPERTYPIFPEALTQGHFSLSPGRPAITFSAKMNLKGEILDTAVVNGTVQNVISLTHATLRKYLDPEAKHSSQSLTVGGKAIEHSLPEGKELRETLTPEDEENFSTLRQLMLGFREQRKKNGAMEMGSLRPNAALSVKMGSAPMKPYEMQVTEGRYYIGDPIIQLRLQDDFNPHEVRDESKNYLVSMLMNLAGHIAGQFCATRNIPAVFDGTWYDPEYGRITPENISQFGGKGFYRLATPKAFSSSEPVHHHMLGLNAYVKSTSPLRRFTDVIAHYQIEAALRFEAEHGRKFNGITDMPELASEENLESQEQAQEHEDPTTDAESAPTSLSSTPFSPLPFSKTDLDNHLTYSQPLRTRLREVSQFSTQHWACMLLFRAFYFAECALPASFPVLLRTPRLVSFREGTVYSGVIANLGVNCVISVPEGCVGKDRIDVFGIVDAKITAVDMATLEVKMEATEFVREYERVGEWA